MKSLIDFKDLKKNGRKFSMLTCFDASLSKAMELAEIDAVLIGDSLGMTMQGNDSTLYVNIEDMVYHTKAVSRTNKKSFIITDLPFMSYATIEDTIASSKAVMQAGAHMVKIEGGAWLSSMIKTLNRNGVPVCVHLGLTPQSVHIFGGYKVQAQTRAAADLLINECKAVVDAGANMLLLECVPEQIGKEITDLFPDVPVVGIGAGKYTDGQVLVVQDILGLNFMKTAKFVKNFMLEQSGSNAILDAIKAYHVAVLNHEFPSKEYTYQKEI